MTIPTLVLAALLLVALAIYLLFHRTVIPQEDCEGPSSESDKKNVSISGPQRVPGDSPAEFVGDPSNDVLVIESLDLCPNPPDFDFVLKLCGDITEDIGRKPQLHLVAYPNGRRGPWLTNTLCPGPTKMKIIQHGRPLEDREVPEKGKVEMSYKNLIPSEWLKKGWYTVRVEMYASEEVGKARLTGFEGGVWIEGGVGDGCGGWE